MATCKNDTVHIQIIRYAIFPYRSVVPNLFLIEYHLEVPYRRRVPPGSRKTQFDKISIYSQVEHTNELTVNKEQNLMRGLHLFLLHQLVDAGHNFAHSTSEIMPGRSKTVPAL